MIIKPDNFILLSLGTNLGSRELVLLKALRNLEDSKIIQSLKVSQWYETEPVGYLDQPWFLNIAVSGFTEMSAIQLLKLCKSLEYLAGRKTREKWHERELDVDILIFGNEIHSLPEMTIPHPYMNERRFVLQSVCDLAPEFKHPILKKSMFELLNECKDNSKVYLYKGGIK